MFEVVEHETPTPVNPLGAKGIGESGTIGSTPAVQSAVVDALAHLGVRHIDMPATPERVWRAIRDAAGEAPRDGHRRDLSDHFEIHALLNRYPRAMDAQDWALLRTVYTSGCDDRLHVGRWSGGTGGGGGRMGGGDDARLPRVAAPRLEHRDRPRR